MSPANSRRESRGVAATRPVEDLQPTSNVITSYRWGWYLLSLFVPMVGMIIALLLYDQESREVRKVGRNCLFIAFLIWVVFPLLMVLALVFLGVMAALAWMSDMVPPAD